MKLYRFLRAALRFCADEATGRHIEPQDYDNYYPMIDAYREWRGLPSTDEMQVVQYTTFYAQQEKTASVSYEDALSEIQRRVN